MPKFADYYAGQSFSGKVWHALRPTEGANKRRSPAFCGSTPRNHEWHWLRQPGKLETGARLCGNCSTMFSVVDDLLKLTGDAT
jgi:hypothetical protein